MAPPPSFSQLEELHYPEQLARVTFGGPGPQGAAPGLGAQTMWAPEYTCAAMWAHMCICTYTGMYGPGHYPPSASMSFMS